jgi:integrase
MANTKPTPGIDTRHRKACPGPRADGKCCTPTFQAYVYDKRNDRLIRHTEPTITGAKQWRRDAIHALEHGDAATLNPSKRTVAAALEALVAGMEDGSVLDRSGRCYRPATVRSYRQASETYIAPSLGHLRLGEVQRGDVQRMVDKLHAKGMSGSTIRNKLDPLRVVYRRALQDDEVTRNPTEKLRLPAMDTKSRSVGNPERVGELLAALPDELRAVWTVAFYAGLRIGELRALRWSAVDFEAGVIRVLAGWDDQAGEQETKTEAGTRSVPLVGRVRAELLRHQLATGRRGDDLVFGRSASEAFVRSTLRTHTLKAWDAAELAPLTPHEARHCAASYFAAAGLTPKEAQTAMGHADIRTTLNIYAKAVPGWESGAAAKLDAFLDGGRSLTEIGAR